MSDGRGRLAGTVDGRWLVEHRRMMERTEAEELARLVEFDRDQLWALDGFFNCVSWMVWYLGMARSTAFEKLRIGYELDRRPVIAEAFADAVARPGGRSGAGRAGLQRGSHDHPCRAGGAGLPPLRRPGSPARRRPPAIRNVMFRPAGDGLTTVTVTLTDSEAAEFRAVLQHFIDNRWHPSGPVDESPRGHSAPAAPATPRGTLPVPVDESPTGDSRPADPDAPLGGPVDESPAVDRGPGAGPLQGATRSELRADAFVDLTAVALAHASGGAAAGDDRYMLHIVTTDDGRSYHTLDGTPLHPLDATRIRCDASTVKHITSPTGDLLCLGRRSRTWNTNQRRAAAVRDGGRCRIPGCANSIYDIHHITPWEAGGTTDIDNAMCVCRSHHRLIHAGYRIDGHPDGELRFFRPDGSYVGSTWPARLHSPQLALAGC